MNNIITRKCKISNRVVADKYLRRTTEGEYILIEVADIIHQELRKSSFSIAEVENILTRYTEYRALMYKLISKITKTLKQQKKTIYINICHHITYMIYIIYGKFSQKLYHSF